MVSLRRSLPLQKLNLQMLVQWYPGHIAKAERQLKEQLKRVDVVLEIRDARIPLASHHPQVRDWIGAKPRLLVLNRQDAIPEAIAKQWRAWFQECGETPYFTNARQGVGIVPLVNAAKGVGTSLNQRRRDRGLRPRPVRAVAIGFPNVGKSALINRIVGRKAVASARRPGVTRQLHWVRISEDIELLDAPGVIPMRLDDQTAALKLAICEDIGEAAYDNQRIAAGFVDLLTASDRGSVLTERYGRVPDGETGEQFLSTLASQRFKSDRERTARQLLDDFRKGRLGPLPLEMPPT